MKYIKASYKKYSKIYNIILLSISISITLGLILSFCLDKELVNNIYNYFLNHVNNYKINIFNNIAYPIVIYTSIFILSLTLIGSFIPFLMIIIENISIGFLLGIILRIKAIKGLLFGIIYFTLTKLLYIIVLIYLTINIYKFIRTLLLNIKKKENISIYNLYSNIIIKTLCCIITISLYNVIMLFIGPHIFEMFTFLI